MATARDGEDALEKIKKYKPDVLTLDVDMPKLNGIDTLKKIMTENPMPVIMVSSHTSRGNKITVEALSLGAVDFISHIPHNTPKYCNSKYIPTKTG